ncbi:hypothetical protein Ahy_A03g015757 [Arachis hypogaea]|uniref:MD-2-related lipid-recognition domain-containing protein n=1 Tax=Arachis hypogaea TaxID=3818 RepID=A0A445E1E3_ARAHY|nr:hypothetical protein Ahy_A03g015757 [Arachis hypogaea]
MDFPKLNILLCLSIFLLSSFRAHAKVKFNYCDKKANYDVKVSAVEISPDPVVSGEAATFKIKASSGQAISGGDLIIAVSYLGIPVRTENHDFCEEVSSCPVSSGDFVISHTQTLPSFTPPRNFCVLVQSSCMNPRFLTGSYTLKMTLKDNKDELLTCIKFSFTIKFGSMVSDA